jgi:hypothetical protein
MAKPSLLWPVDPIVERRRITETTTNPPPKPGHADILQPDPERDEKSKEQSGKVADQNEMEMMPSTNLEALSEDKPDLEETPNEPKAPKVLMKDPNARPLEIHSQIQLYATTEWVDFLKPSS